jgi:hypothetical protein
MLAEKLPHDQGSLINPFKPEQGQSYTDLQKFEFDGRVAGNNQRD